ncbi:MAG: hypothetical protein COV71_02875 [Candidatus Omnitrophica bacterium CG11_big_fil_rev_8_21_14_0_20_41_12]|nr:MAG: hypothetical protein COV71_02875 [Candidatus Omnitrophica bacterium CG11_big_fil_rev_8_21_14_0_20_41_12]
MFKNIAFVLLLGITVFSMIKYVSELKERYRLQDNLVRAQDQIAVLAQEKQNLLQEIGKEKAFKEELALKNKGLKDYLKASKDRIMRLFQTNTNIQNDLEDVNDKFSILKAENRSLIDSRQRLYEENEQAKVKLNSITELKKAIRELKAKGHSSHDLAAEGNQGFLIKDGRSTMKVKIEVVPAQTKK